MSTIFDDGAEERERIEMRQQMYQAQQRQMQSTAIHPLQNSAQNAVLQGGNYNGGLLGQAGNAISGLWK